MTEQTEEKETNENKKEERLINPITGESVDESISEREAKSRGYFDFQFILKYLEDENEFVKFFIVDGKRILVHIEKPHLQYKKKPQINHERVLQIQEEVLPQVTEETEDHQLSVVPVVTCSIVSGDPDNSCLSCSG